MSVDTLAVTSKEALSTESQTWAQKTKGLTIVDRATYVNAGQLLTSVKYFRGQIAAWFAPHVERAMETKRKAEAARKALVDERDRMEAPLVEAEEALKRSLLAWEAQQEAMRQEQERQLQAEAQRQAEEATLAAAAALEAEATATGDDAMLQEAHDILEQPIDTPNVFVQTSTPKIQGVSYRDNWKIHPTVDVKALAAAVAAGTVPASFLLPNMVALNQFARATKGTQKIPGARVFNDRQVTARTT